MKSFGPPPEGFAYREDFISIGEETNLLSRLSTLPFSSFQMHGVTSKRQVIHYGWDYQYEHWKIAPTESAPEFLTFLRDRAADSAGIRAEELEEVLLSKYPPGAGIGWHRDAPMFGSPVLGLSLGSGCLMRFRRKSKTGFLIREVQLNPRSIYSLDGEIRNCWQHSVPSVKNLRYSVTFRRVNESSKTNQADVEELHREV